MDPYKNFTKEQVDAFEGRIVIVTGGRDYDDPIMVDEILDFLRPDLLVEGGCKTGADKFARDWAYESRESGGRVISDTVDAEWNKYGRSAGPVRNLAMVSKYARKENVIIVAFPGGSGTANCVKNAKELNMIVLKVEG